MHILTDGLTPTFLVCIRASTVSFKLLVFLPFFLHILIYFAHKIIFFNRCFKLSGKDCLRQLKMWHSLLVITILPQSYITYPKGTVRVYVVRRHLDCIIIQSLASEYVNNVLFSSFISSLIPLLDFYLQMTIVENILVWAQV